LVLIELREETMHCGLAAISTVLVLGLLPGSSLQAQERAPTPVRVATQDVPPPTPSMTVLGARQANSVLGKEVRSTANENMGRIVDVIVDRTGHVRAAVIDFGGFFGVGSRKIAVDWNALSFAPTADHGHDFVTLELTREQVKSAPEYKDKRAVIVLGAAEPFTVDSDR
jgi:hypothetical protein